MEVAVDNSKLGETADPFNLYRDELKDYREYLKSKDKLLGTLKSMTTKELDEKLSSLFVQQQATFEQTIQRKTTNANLQADINKFRDDNMVDSLCPLQNWKNIIFLITTKHSENRRIDQDFALTQFSTTKQRHNEPLQEYLNRFSSMVESFQLIGLQVPSEESQATRFFGGLDPSIYASLLTYIQTNSIMVGTFTHVI